LPAAASNTKPHASAPLLLGFGNVLLADDGAGVRLIEALRGETWIDGTALNCVDAGTLSFSLLPYLEAAESMLVADAAAIGGVAGSLRLFEGEAMDTFLRTNRRRTVHEVGLIDLLDMARIEGSLPPRRALLCIQPGLVDWSERLSADVSRALPEAIRTAMQLLARWSRP
jgi:hydrogenase maturation protease